MKGNIRADCPPISLDTKERQEGERVTGAPLPIEIEERECEVAPQMKTTTSVEKIDKEWK